VARLTRQELKKDEFLSTVETVEQFAKQHTRLIIIVVVAAMAVVSAVLAYRTYSERQEAEANAALGAALKTFDAPVGAGADALGGTASFATASEKYKKALEQFNEIIVKYPKQKAADIARYHAGLCESELGNRAAAIKVLQEAANSPDQNLAALARLALAGEYMKTGASQEAIKLYRQLADHPTLTVPRATALLALADAYRETQPAQARAIYEQLQREWGDNPYLASTVNEDLASLPK
jgi:tetratricopeptide (TPR) repeat protein